MKKELEGTPSLSSSSPPVDLSSSSSSPPPRRLLLDCYCGVGLFGLVSHDAFDVSCLLIRRNSKILNRTKERIHLFIHSSHTHSLTCMRWIAV